MVEIGRSQEEMLDQLIQTEEEGHSIVKGEKLMIKMVIAPYR